MIDLNQCALRTGVVVMHRLIPFLRLRPGRYLAPAIFLVTAIFAAQLAADEPNADRWDEISQSPKNTGEFLKRCKQDSIYCEEQFTAYIQRYASVRVEELARQPSYRALRERLRDPAAFDGICLPRERLLSDDFAIEVTRGFRRWAEQNPGVHRERVPVGVKTGMRALYPCSS